MKSTLTRLYRTYMPSTAREAIMARRRAGIWAAQGAVFIHVPKCAGSSVNDALYGQFMGHIPAHVIDRFGPASAQDLPKFSLLRDPVARAISAYRFVRAGSGEGAGVTAQVRAPERYQIPEFESFDRFAQDWLPRQTISRIDPVFRTQASYVCAPDGRTLVDHLGRVEDMAPTVDWLTNTLGKRIEIGRTNVTPNRAKASIAPSPASLEVLRQVYAQDFALMETR